MLFDNDLPKDNSPIERIDITYLRLFYSDTDMQQFKTMCRAGMVKMWPTSYQTRTLSEYIFELVKLNYGIQTNNDGSASKAAY